MASVRMSGGPIGQTPTATLFSTSTTVDPALASLFASSSGPVRVPKPQPRTLVEQKQSPRADQAKGSDQDSSSSSDTGSASSASDEEVEEQQEPERPRKRRRVEIDDLETSYFNRIAKEEEREERSRSTARFKPGDDANVAPLADVEVSESVDEVFDIPKHEALAGGDNGFEKEKHVRTVFLSNVSVDAIKSKTSRKLLLKHLEKPLVSERDDASKSIVESIRFRSTAYGGASGPKKAGYATKDVMEQTTKSTNAYVVFSSQTAAKTVAKELNGTVVLDRHLRVDYLANPSSTDHKRCVFVGNLNFVDEEKPKDDDIPEDIQPRRARARLPADAEEGLWREFSKVGKVENVRVVRDKYTRVGKGFAYVQFADQNGVEVALLLDEKKFPPMLPRKLRVSRAKKVREKSSKAPLGRSLSGFRDRLWKDRKSMRPPPGAKRKRDEDIRESMPKKLVFEGHRASKPTSKDSNQKKRPTTKPSGRSAKRGAAFKASGGQKKWSKSS